MNDDGEANKAIEAMNGHEMEGRPLRVNEARPKEDSPSEGSDW
jgi:RNA recognition motif-containing protein